MRSERTTKVPADGRTDTMKLTGAYHDCANAPKMKKRDFMRTRYQEPPSGKNRGTLPTSWYVCH